METGQVRAILGDHLRDRSHGPHTPSLDPASLVPAPELAERLQALQKEKGDAALRQVAQDYIALWARTFRTLVKQLRGRPERTLQLWCDEVYPFLRGQRHPIRVQRRGRGMAHVTMGNDLPAPYLCGLLEGFLGLSGAESRASPVDRTTYAVHYRLHPQDQAARMIHWMSGLRMPLLLTAGLAAALGVVSVGISDVWKTIAVLVGAVAAQSGANAFHDLRRPNRGPLSAPVTGRTWRMIQAIGSYGIAATSLAFLARDNPTLLVFAGGGLGLTVAYMVLNQHGYGPAISVLSHGPLTVLGAAWAMDPALAAQQALMLTCLGLVPGLLTANALSIGDIADRPIDEAGGKRTLAVRLPPLRNLALVAGLGTGAVVLAAWLIGTHLHHARWNALWMLPNLGIALGLVREVKRNLDDPHGLARARFTAMGLHVLTSLTLTAFLLGATP